MDVYSLHPIALAFLGLIGLLIILVPKRNTALALFLLGSTFFPLSQSIIISSLDFNMVRILVIIAWLRIMIKREHRTFQMNRIDWMIILWAISYTLIYTVLWGTSDALINRLGKTFDAVGIYFFCRVIIRDINDITSAIKSLCYITIPLSILILAERQTGKNLFFIFGGVPEFTIIRDGRLRCQGPFGHSILAGTYAASIMPLYVSLFFQESVRRFFPILGIVSVLVIVFSSSSSGPVLSLIAGLLALWAWRFHNYMRPIRWGILLSIIFLHIIMKAPVWSLIHRVNIFGGSTGYHRYRLIDQFINRFDEWWLLGVKSTAHWGYYTFDITNNFIRQGIDGGLLTLVLFILIIVLLFQAIGQCITKFNGFEPYQRLFWCMGASLFVHIVSFMGVSYWDQTIVIWYFLLATISSLKGFSPTFIPGQSHLNIS